MRLCSACLLGVQCRYDGRSKPDRNVLKLAKKEALIPVCPEQLGGLPTPREASEITNGKVITCSGMDVTANFKRGAKAVLKLSKILNIKSALLKQRSASCGSGEIYDGGFSGKVIAGDGVTAALLKRNGIRVITEDKVGRLLSVVLFLMIISSGLCSFADILYLKNGRKMEGVIENETATSVVLNVGIGTVAVSRNDIESIENKSDAHDEKMLESWEGMAGSADNASAPVRELSRGLRDVKQKRLEAMKYRSKSESLRHKMSNIERELTSLYVKFENLNDRLRRMSQGDVIAYNKVVAEINSTNARIGRYSEEMSQSIELRDDLDAAVSKNVSVYNDSLLSLSQRFDDLYGSMDEAKLSTDESFFYNSMRDEIVRFRRDFSHKEISYHQKGNEILVDVMLNNRVSATMLVDTGASILLISRDLANKLKIYDGGGARTIQITLADGSTTTAVPVVLQSVQVGDAVVRNVRGAISESPPSGDVDGLLGMSFLSNFILRIDSKAKKLILEEFDPKG